MRLFALDTPPRIPLKMKRFPIVLVAALFVGAALPASPASAQAGASMTVAPIRTESSSIDGPFAVRLAVYDARSFELFWDRIPNAITYRVQVGGRTVQENGAVSRYVAGVSLAGGFDYTLTALDRSGSTLAVRRFRVQPASGTQLVAVGGAGTPTNPAAGPIRTGSSRIGGAIPVRLDVYDRQSFELFWERVPGAARYRLSRDGRTVREGDGISHYVSGIDGAASFAYTLVALDRAGNALRRTSFTVSPRGATQLVTGGSSSTPTDPATPPPADGPVRTGSTSLPGDIAVRLAVYDARSYELFWERVPGAVRYRLSRGASVVQASDAVSHFVAGADSARRFAYTLEALDRGGDVLRTARFTVALRGNPQLVATGGGTGVPVTPTDPTAPGGADDSLFLPAALAAPLLAPIEPGSPLSVANHETFVRAFYDIAAPDVLDNLLRQVERVQSELRDAAAGADSRFVAESAAPAQGGANELVFACPDGGRVRAVLDDAAVPASDSDSLMRFERCVLGDDTLSGITREVPIENGLFAGFDSRTFGGYRLDVRLYPFMDEAVGLGDEGERFTVETEAGLSTTVFGRVAERSSAFPDGFTQDSRNWRGNWRLDRAQATLLVTDLHADDVRYSDDTEEGDRIKPYFVARGTVTNGREVTTINQSTFVEIRRSGGGASGMQVFRDAEGGIMDLVADAGFEGGGGQQTRVRIDTDGVILNRALPAELEATRYLVGR